ncbi:MAG: hypothetical protein ABI134_00075 [Byssovorax sp.]
MSDLGQSIDIESSFFEGTDDAATIRSQNVAMRLSTARGTYFEDPNYGLVLSDYVRAGLTPDDLARIPGEVRDQLELDAEIASAEVTATAKRQPSGAVSLELAILLTSTSGEVDPVINLSTEA